LFKLKLETGHTPHLDERNAFTISAEELHEKRPLKRSKFITVFTVAHSWTLSWTSRIQSTSHYLRI